MKTKTLVLLFVLLALVAVITTTLNDPTGYVVNTPESKEGVFCCEIGERSCYAVGNQSCEACMQVCNNT